MSDLLATDEQQYNEGVAVATKPGGQKPPPPRVRTRLKAEALTGKIPPRMAELIERKLQLQAGATIREIGAYIQQRMGSDQAPEGSESFALQEQRRLKEREETEIYCKQVLKYLKETYGDERTDHFGDVIGYGQVVVVKKETGHIRKLY